MINNAVDASNRKGWLNVYPVDKLPVSEAACSSKVRSLAGLSGLGRCTLAPWGETFGLAEARKPRHKVTRVHHLLVQLRLHAKGNKSLRSTSMEPLACRIQNSKTSRVAPRAKSRSSKLYLVALTPADVRCMYCHGTSSVHGAWYLRFASTSLRSHTRSFVKHTITPYALHLTRRSNASYPL
jgi:hypothetical protein